MKFVGFVVLQVSFRQPPPPTGRQTDARVPRTSEKCGNQPNYRRMVRNCASAARRPDTKLYIIPRAFKSFYGHLLRRDRAK